MDSVSTDLRTDYANTLTFLIDKVNEEEDTVTNSRVQVCESPKQLYFLATLFVLQGILMLLGAFLAWETRKVRSMHAYDCDIGFLFLAK